MWRAGEGRGGGELARQVVGESGTGRFSLCILGNNFPHKLQKEQEIRSSDLKRIKMQILKPTG